MCISIGGNFKENSLLLHCSVHLLPRVQQLCLVLLLNVVTSMVTSSSPSFSQEWSILFRHTGPGLRMAGSPARENYPYVWSAVLFLYREFHDFAGSGVVHLSREVVALVGAIMLGPRI